MNGPLLKHDEGSERARDSSGGGDETGEKQGGWRKLEEEARKASPSHSLTPQLGECFPHPGIPYLPSPLLRVNVLIIDFIERKARQGESRLASMVAAK